MIVGLKPFSLVLDLLFSLYFAILSFPSYSPVLNATDLSGSLSVTHGIRSARYQNKKRSSESLFPASCLLTFPFQPCLLREGWIPPAKTIRSCQLSCVFVKLYFLLMSPFGKATQAVSSTAAETRGCRFKKKKKSSTFGASSASSPAEAC